MGTPRDHLHKPIAPVYEFEDYVLDLNRGCLLHGKEEVKLRKKSFEVLKYLVEHRSHLIGKEELIGAVWPDSFVTDDSLTHCLMEVRHALGDGSQKILKTVPRRGYLFDMEVRELYDRVFNGTARREPGDTSNGPVGVEEVAGFKVVIEAGEHASTESPADTPGLMGANGAVAAVAAASRLQNGVRHSQVVTRARLGLLLLLFLGSLLGWYFHRQTKVRWAREQALPEISRLIDEHKAIAALVLAQQVERYIPTDPALLKLWPAMSSIVNIQTTPPGAEIFMKEYRAVNSGWQYLGHSPLNSIRIPFGALRFKAEKKGFAAVETLEDVHWTVDVFHSDTISIVLDPEGTLPRGMVRAFVEYNPKEKDRVSQEFSPLRPVGPVPMPGDYWIDRYEVTNKEFKAFTDNGGYQKREFWKQPFVKEGQALSWEEAVREFRDSTGQPGPATWEAGDYPRDQDDYPVSGVSWYEAAAYAEFAGKSLPTIYHWLYTAEPWLCADIAPLSNFSGQGPARVGAYNGMSDFGTNDMAGNVKEWCWNEASQGKHYILGGAWDESVCTFTTLDAHSPWHRYPNFGFRCVKYSSKDSISKTAIKIILPEARNYNEQQPVSSAIFRVYQNLYSYDKAPLEPALESSDESNADWKKEKITFNAAYGNERVIACLFLPRRSSPPYQTIVHFPGSSAQLLRSSNDMDMRRIDFILKSGRAVLWPVYKGTFERKDRTLVDPEETSIAYRENMVCLSKDLGRSIDYLETRPDIDRNKIGYYGESWGAALGPIMTALESRLKVSVLKVGGFSSSQVRPEADQINFASRVTIPTLMLNGRYDQIFPLDTSQEPMFRFLATPKEHKRHVIVDAGHWVPRSLLIKETLDWLDRYLGPVKRREQL